METLQQIWNWYGIIMLALLAGLGLLAWLDWRGRGAHEPVEVDYLSEIEHLKNWNYDERLIDEATDRMNKLKKQRSKKAFVDSNGRLIITTEIK